MKILIFLILLSVVSCIGVRRGHHKMHLKSNQAIKAQHDQFAKPYPEPGQVPSDDAMNHSPEQREENTSLKDAGDDDNGSNSLADVYLFSSDGTINFLGAEGDEKVKETMKLDFKMGFELEDDDDQI